MKKVAILFSLVVGWTQTGFAADASPAGDVSAGKGATVTCGACHGPDGNSAVPAFPKLAGQGEKYLLKQMMDIRDGARPVPTMAGQLDGKSDQNLADMAAYYAAQARSGGQADPELVALGEKIYRSGVAGRNVAACSACHSPTGKGNAPAGFPALAGQHADYTAAQLRAYRKGYEDETGRTNDGDAKIMRPLA
jgi:cytochrome c553